MASIAFLLIVDSDHCRLHDHCLHHDHCNHDHDVNN